MIISIATENDFDWLSRNDLHLLPSTLHKKIANAEIYIARDLVPLAWLRFGLFWDNLPFMNMLYVLEAHRRLGVGTALTLYWEQEMRKAGHACVLTSTLANEDAQHFYRKNGYVDIGSFVLLGEASELILRKTL